MKVLVVSPHYDDAPLSLGQSLHDGWLSHQTVTVGVVFGVSNWTVWFHPTRRRTALATPVRLAEEAHAAFRFGYRLRTAGHREAVLRLATTRLDALLDPTFDAQGDPEGHRVTDTLRRWSARYDAMVVPLGLGHHVDHALCAVAGRRISADGGRVAFFEDRPYACSMSDADIAAQVTRFDPTLVSRDVSAPMGREKHRRLFYPSQFDEYFRDAISSDEAAQRPERVWVRPDCDWLDHEETR